MIWKIIGVIAVVAGVGAVAWVCMMAKIMSD
jgi:hypothetical protein